MVKFCETLEAPRLHHFTVRRCVERLWRNSPRRVQTKSCWKLSGRGSLDFTQREGGKNRDAASNIVSFLHTPIIEFIPEQPEDHLYDVTGIRALNVLDWGPEALVWEVLYPGLIKDAEEPSELPDERFGQIGLLWAFLTLRKEELISWTSEHEFHNSCLGLQRPTFHLDIDATFVRARIKPLQEEGWKCRVITITSLAVSIIGMVARDIFDAVIQTDPQISIGLMSKVKLYAFLKQFMSWGADPADPSHHVAVPGWALSADLQNATNTPSRVLVKDTLDGLLDAMHHPCDNFLRFAAELACCERKFWPVAGHPIPRWHARGIMMGEGLSGTFLNAMSATVRSLAHASAREFGGEIPVDATNCFVDAFLSANAERVQLFLDNVDLHPYGLSSQSGDDVIDFALVDMSGIFRMCYRIFEMDPSTSTWFSSKTYATFTEECAVAVEGGRGWHFCDNVKTRLFNTCSDPEILLSHWRSISGAIRFKDLAVKRVVVTLCQTQLRQNQIVSEFYDKTHAPIGLPSNFGGLSHPVGWLPDYTDSLEQVDRNVLYGLNTVHPLEGYKDSIDIYLQDDTRMSVDVSMRIKSLVDFVEDLMAHGHQIGNLCDMVPQLEGEVFAKTKTRRKNYKIEHGLVSLPDYVKRVISRFALVESLSPGEFAPKVHVNPIPRIRDRLRSLRSKYGIRPIPEGQKCPSVYEVIKRTKEHMDDFVFNESMVSTFLQGLGLPSLAVHFKI